MFATDVDGDGDIDVLSASGFDDKIAWYENTTPLPDIPTVSEWGMFVMTLLLLATGTLVVGRRRDGGIRGGIRGRESFSPCGTPRATVALVSMGDRGRKTWTASPALGSSSGAPG